MREYDNGSEAGTDFCYPPNPEIRCHITRERPQKALESELFKTICKMVLQQMPLGFRWLDKSFPEFSVVRSFRAELKNHQF